MNLSMALVVSCNLDMFLDKVPFKTKQFSVRVKLIFFR